MTKLLAVDPGNTHSAYVSIDAKTCRPLTHGKVPNDDLLEALYRDFGANMRAQTPKGVYVITSHPEFEKLYGRTASRRRKLYNGMIPCSLFMYF